MAQNRLTMTFLFCPPYDIIIWAGQALDFTVIDDFIQVNDRDAFLTARELVKKESIFAGGSSGAALWAAQQIAQSLTEPKNIVVIFPDSGYRYISKIYNDDWMKEQRFI